jgi:hypothetical protein
MTIRNAAGARLTKAQLTALTATVVDPPAVLTVTEAIYQDFDPTPDDDDNASGFERSRRLLYVPGASKFSAADLDALFKVATFTSITPNSGAAAGGTPVVIKGTNFAGTIGVTIGGVAATAFKVVDDTTITCTTGAHAAGAVAVVVADDNANVTANAAYTYV